MDNLNLGLIILAGFLVVQSFVILELFRQAVNRLAEVNKQLLIAAVGKEDKPETLRALVASAKPPQGKLPGIADKKKTKKEESKNTNYTMEIGVTNGVQI